MKHRSCLLRWLSSLTALIKCLWIRQSWICLTSSAISWYHPSSSISFGVISDRWPMVNFILRLIRVGMWCGCLTRSLLTPSFQFDDNIDSVVGSFTLPHLLSFFIQHNFVWFPSHWLFIFFIIWHCFWSFGRNANLFLSHESFLFLTSPSPWHLQVGSCQVERLFVGSQCSLWSGR